MIIGSANITYSPRCFSDASQWVVSADEAQLGRLVLVRLLAFARLIFAFFPTPSNGRLFFLAGWPPFKPLSPQMENWRGAKWVWGGKYLPEYFDFKPAQKSWGENMRVNILLLNLFNVQARQVLMESRLPNSVLSKVILNLMSSLFTLHYIACTRFFM